MKTTLILAMLFFAALATIQAIRIAVQSVQDAKERRELLALAKKCGIAGLGGPGLGAAPNRQPLRPPFAAVCSVFRR